MIYPKFIDRNGTIGVCAPSAGVGRKIDDYLESTNYLKLLGFNIKETASVRVNSLRSTTAKKRAKEFYDLTADDSVDMILFAAGGDYMFEIMPYVDYSKLIEKPKWLMGKSDPTNILYDVTCGLDIATFYGFNGVQYYVNNPKWQKDNINIITGNLVKQRSYKKYQDFNDKQNNIETLNHDVKWLCKKDVDVKGRIIGGCFEVIVQHLGMPFDHSLDFVNRYADDGIIWFFDVYGCSSLDFYYGLLKMKYMGLFKNCKAVIVGRIYISNISFGIDYYEAADKALGNIPHIMDADIGHTIPCMTIINGSIAHVKYKDGKGELSFELK